MQTHTIIFIGPQGSGKGTQVEHLKKFLATADPDKNIVEIQTGKGFREIAETDGYTATRIKDLLENGSLVPDFITEAIVVNQLITGLQQESHLIMDGFPRNLAQAEFIDDALAFYLRECLVVIHLDTPEDVVVERMLSRGRSDDTEASIKERLRLYSEQTEPLIEHYKKQPGTRVITINGAQAIEQVQADIRAELGI